MSDRPLWRRLYDDVERAVAPPLEQLVHSPEFAQVSAWTMQAAAAMRDQVNGTAARVWHLVNLPAGTDVQRLRAQVGALDREVRRLTLQLAEQSATEREESPDAVAARPDERARQGEEGDRAQHPSGE